MFTTLYPKVQNNSFAGTFNYPSRRSELRASERCALTDEKLVAREIFGRHHSDIGGMSSDSEDEFINGVTTAPATSKCIHVSTTSEASNTEK